MIGLFVLCFHVNRFKNIKNQLLKLKITFPHEINLIHPAVEPEHIINRYIRSDKEIKELESEMFSTPYNIFITENIGEDLGSYHEIFYKLNKRYKYFFFLNEAATIIDFEFLDKIYKKLEENNKIDIISPMVCTGMYESKYCVPTTYFGIRSSASEYLSWDKPKNRQDTERQEMCLFYPQLNKNNRIMYQIGNGLDMIKYKNTVSYGEGEY